MHGFVWLVSNNYAQLCSIWINIGFRIKTTTILYLKIGDMKSFFLSIFFLHSNLQKKIKLYMKQQSNCIFLYGKCPNLNGNRINMKWECFSINRIGFFLLIDLLVPNICVTWDWFSREFGIACCAQFKTRRRWKWYKIMCGKFILYWYKLK